MEYEIYNIEIQNKSTGIVILDEDSLSKNIYLEDKNGVKYTWYNHEIAKDDITVEKGFNKSISIKFNKEYRPTLPETKINFINTTIGNNKKIKISIDI